MLYSLGDICIGCGHSVSTTAHRLASTCGAFRLAAAAGYGERSRPALKPPAGQQLKSMNLDYG
eukprot:scaffold2611_cov114-Isochrysis_galbana.AAC.18